MFVPILKIHSSIPCQLLTALKKKNTEKLIHDLHKFKKNKLFTTYDGLQILNFVNVLQNSLTNQNEPFRLFVEFKKEEIRLLSQIQFLETIFSKPYHIIN